LLMSPVGCGKWAVDYESEVLGLICPWLVPWLGEWLE
jgi:hypothetical protein